MSKKKTASVLKIGLIYTISNIIVRGMAFITTPIFTRLLSQAEYGDFSNISSWANIISIVVTLQLHVSIVRAKYDYKDEINKYLSSILILGNIVTLIWWGIAELNMGWFENILDMQRIYIRIIFFYTLFSPAMQMLIYKNRIYSQYKQVILFTWITLLCSAGGSILLVLLFSNKLLGRVVGNYFIIAIVDIILWIYIILKGKCISIKYWKYALKFSVPLIPHELAGIILLSSDRIIIKRLCGSEDAALYSLAYTISTIASVLLSSLNQAWQPWLYDHIEAGKTDDVRKWSIPYTIIFAAGCVGIMLIGPEIIYIFGGPTYMDAKYVIPPVCFGIMLQFIYTLYSNIEFYKKKTIWISVATLLSACINIALNFLLIPICGYIVAAYTTVIGYAFMVLFHYIVVRSKTDLIDLYNAKILCIIGISVGVLMGFALLLYETTGLRYMVILICGLLIMTLFFVKRKNIIKILKNKE